MVTKLRKLGNESLLNRSKTAFLCSRIVPQAAETAILQWIDTLRPDADCVLCGNHSYMEHVVFDLLLKNKILTVLVLAETFPDTWSGAIVTALAENRLLVVTHCDESVHFVSGRSAFDRNKVMLSLADRVVVGYCTPGGNIDRQTAGLNNVTLLFGSSESAVPAESAVVSVSAINVPLEKPETKKATTKSVWRNILRRLYIVIQSFFTRRH